mgnify:FL=1
MMNYVNTHLIIKPAAMIWNGGLACHCLIDCIAAKSDFVLSIIVRMYLSM